MPNGGHSFLRLRSLLQPFLPDEQLKSVLTSKRTINPSQKGAHSTSREENLIKLVGGKIMRINAEKIHVRDRGVNFQGGHFKVGNL